MRTPKCLNSRRLDFGTASHSQRTQSDGKMMVGKMISSINSTPHHFTRSWVRRLLRLFGSTAIPGRACGTRSHFTMSPQMKQISQIEARLCNLRNRWMKIQAIREPLSADHSLDQEATCTAQRGVAPWPGPAVPTALVRPHLSACRRAAPCHRCWPTSPSTHWTKRSNAGGMSMPATPTSCPAGVERSGSNRPRTRRRNLIKLGANPGEVHMASRSRKAYRRMSRN